MIYFVHRSKGEHFIMNTQFLNQDQLDKITKSVTQQAEEAADYSKNSFDAWMKTSNIWMDGAQTLWKSYTDMTNTAREQQTNAIKTFMSCKTLNDMTETSTKLAQETLEQTMTNATTLSEKTIKICMDSMEPINDTISKGFQQQMKKAKAA